MIHGALTVAFNIAWRWEMGNSRQQEEPRLGCIAVWRYDIAYTMIIMQMLCTHTRSLNLSEVVTQLARYFVS